MSTVSLQKLSKHFNATTAVQEFDLDVQSGEFFSILGPSGCGKTTLLRMIAGFEKPTTGSIVVNGRDLTNVPPQERAIGMVFQNYALFPHMTVYQNVAFGLETRNVPAAKIHQRVEKILEAVHLVDKIDSPVPQLSGGEQQRVAVARALVVEPEVLLFDEPLSNLDVALRIKTREEIRLLQKQINITTIYVTHDQSEAMSLSDRIAVMRKGRIEQVGTPAEMYESPASAFVAEFLGGANILDGMMNRTTRRFKTGRIVIPVTQGLRPGNDGDVSVAVKPEAISLHKSNKSDSAGAFIRHREYLGFVTNFIIDASGVQLRVSMMSSPATRDLVPGEKVRFTLDWNRCTILPRS